jgi:hypothetical protein
MSLWARVAAEKIRVLLLAAILLLVTSSQFITSEEQQSVSGERLLLDPAEQAMQVANSEPMSTIRDAVSFSGTTNATIRGHSYGANSSTATGVGSGDGNHWWKTPVIGERFTVNASMDSWRANNSALILLINIHTNQGLCASLYVYWYEVGNQSIDCNSPQSGGFIYIRVSINYHYAEENVEANYSIEVTESILDQTTTEYEFPDGDLGTDSTYYNPATLEPGMSITGTLEQGWNTDDYIHLLQGLNTVHRVNVTLTGISDFDFRLEAYQSLGDCNLYYSTDFLSRFLDCRVTGNNPIVHLWDTRGYRPNHGNWTASYTIEQINPIEDESTGDISGPKFVAVNETHSGSVETNWDTQDDYAIIIEHGHEMKFRLSTSANITLRIPWNERCNSGDVTDIMVQAGMPLELSCTTTNASDAFHISLIPMTSEVATYTIISRAGQTRSDMVCCENDAGTGRDAPPFADYEQAISLPLGTSNGSFIHVTDTSDGYKLDIPPGEGRMVFIQGNSVHAVGWGTWTSQGDLLYSIFQNTGDVISTPIFGIYPLDLQTSRRELHPEVYAPQNYSISVHSFSAPDLTWYDHSSAHFPAYIGSGSSFSIPDYASVNLSAWRLGSSSSYSKSIPLEFDPTESLRITATQASGGAVRLQAVGSSGVYFEDTQVTLKKYLERTSIVEWYRVIFSGLDGSELTVSVTQPTLTTSTREENAWISSPGTVWGRLGTSSDEGFDAQDYWTVTLNYGHSYQLSLQVMDGLQAQFQGGWGYDSMIIGSCSPSPGGNELTYNTTFRVEHISGNGRYHLDLRYGGSCSSVVPSLSDQYSQSSASPGESIYLRLDLPSGTDELDERNISVDLFAADGSFVTDLPFEHFGELQGQSWNEYRDVRVGIPDAVSVGLGIFGGSYFVRLMLEDIVIDSMGLNIQASDVVLASSAFSVLGPGDTPRWLVDVHARASSAPQEWNFTLNETWMRDVDGTPVVIDPVQVSTPTTDSGIGLVETSLPWQPRPGSLIFQTCTISTPAREPGIEAAEIESIQSWTVGLIDLTQYAPSGRGPYTPSSERPTNDLFITIRALMQGGIPMAGVSGVAEVYDSDRLWQHNMRQSHRFGTDGWGEDVIRVDYALLAAGNYTVELTVDDAWSDWIESVVQVFEFEVLDASGADSPDTITDERGLSLTATARRDTLVAGETIIIDWSVEGGQPLNVLEWYLFDSAGRVLAADTTAQVGQTEGVLSIVIPDSLAISLRATVLLTATGLHGTESSVWIYIGNLEDDTGLIVNVKPNLARPGDTLTVSLELDSDIDYLYWVWSLYEGGYEIAEGEGWVEATEAEFSIELEQRDLQTLVLSVTVVDGEGTTHQKSVTIELRDLVELAVESAFDTNAGDPLTLEWSVTSPSLTNADEATSITIQLIQMGTGTVAYETSRLVSGYSGKMDVLIPMETRPGTYLLHVELETVGGATLSSQSLIDVHEPREKNIILGVELPPWSSILSGVASTLLILNLVAIWAVLIVGRRRRAAAEAGEELEDDSGYDIDHLMDNLGTELQSYPLSGDSTQGSHPPSILGGMVHDDGFEWLEHPAESGVWWYRTDRMEEWIRSN